jgi:hypothetical protein
LRGILTGSQFTPTAYRDVKETFFGSKTVVETAREYWIHYRGKDDMLEERSRGKLPPSDSTSL